LVFAANNEQEERREAKKVYKASNTPEDVLKVDLSRLNEHYVLNQVQARSSET